MRIRRISKWGMTISIMHNECFDGLWIMSRTKIKKYLTNHKNRTR